MYDSTVVTLHTLLMLGHTLYLQSCTGMIMADLIGKCSLRCASKQIQFCSNKLCVCVCVCVCVMCSFHPDRLLQIRGQNTAARQTMRGLVCLFRGERTPLLTLPPCGERRRYACTGKLAHSAEPQSHDTTLTSEAREIRLAPPIPHPLTTQQRLCKQSRLNK